MARGDAFFKFSKVTRHDLNRRSVCERGSVGCQFGGQYPRGLGTVVWLSTNARKSLQALLA